MSETDILSEQEIAEIEKHYEISIDSMFARSNIPALCHTVRAAWADNDKWQRAAGHWKAQYEVADETNTALRDQLAQCEGSRRVHELDNHHNALACGYCAGPLKEELTRLQSQLAQVEKERSELQRALDGWASGTLTNLELIGRVQQITNWQSPEGWIKISGGTGPVTKE